MKRHEYVKPSVTRVPLAAEEAVLAICKNGTGAVRTSLCNKNAGACTNKNAGS